MDEQQLKQMKNELKQELSAELDRKVEDEVQEESEEQLQEVMKSTLFLNRFKGGFITFLAIIIALGEYSEAVSVIADTVDTVRSEFTHDVEYETLSRIHVGNTADYISDLMGSPQVSRSIAEGIDANYYYSEKFLLTLFFSQDRVTAYTLLPLLSDFNLEVSDHTRNEDKPWLLGLETFSTFPANPQTYLIDHSKTASYYLEGLDTGRSGLFLKGYLGKLSYTEASSSEEIAALYKLEVHGTDSEIAKQQALLREKETPNFFGLGEIDVSLIEKSILSGAQISNYFGHLQ